MQARHRLRQAPPGPAAAPPRLTGGSVGHGTVPYGSAGAGATPLRSAPLAPGLPPPQPPRGLKGCPARPGPAPPAGAHRPEPRKRVPPRATPPLPVDPPRRPRGKRRARGTSAAGSAGESVPSLPHPRPATLPPPGSRIGKIHKFKN